MEGKDMRPQHPPRREILPENPTPVGAGIRDERKSELEKKLREDFVARCHELTQQGKTPISPDFRPLYKDIADTSEKLFAIAFINVLVVKLNSAGKVITAPEDTVPASPTLRNQGAVASPEAATHPTKVTATTLRGNAYWKAKQGEHEGTAVRPSGVKIKKNTQFSD